MTYGAEGKADPYRGAIYASEITGLENGLRAQLSTNTTRKLTESFAAAGMIDQTFKWLEKAFKQHNPSIPYLNLYPFYEPLRDDPRFKDLLRRMNLTGD